MSRLRLADFDPVEFGQMAAAIVREFVFPLRDRIDELEREKNIDAQVIDELGECLKRVESLENKESIRDAGYWRDGIVARKGDAMTHAGSLWIALRDTSAKPCSEHAADWRLGARKGRDANDAVTKDLEARIARLEHLSVSK